MLTNPKRNLRALALAGLGGCETARPAPSNPPAVQSEAGGPADAVRFDRALGARRVIGQYPDMEAVEVEYDKDTVELAYEYAKKFLKLYPNLAGIICCDMSNPVGAARAVVEAGRQGQVLIVGMDHDQEAPGYLRDGVIYALGFRTATPSASTPFKSR